MANTLKDTYTTSLISEHTIAAWEYNNTKVSMRTNVDFLLGNHMLLRGQNRRELELANLFCLPLPNEGIQKKNTLTRAFVALINHGKTN